MNEEVQIKTDGDNNIIIQSIKNGTLNIEQKINLKELGEEVNDKIENLEKKISNYLKKHEQKNISKLPEVDQTIIRNLRQGNFDEVLQLIIRLDKVNKKKKRLNIFLVLLILFLSLALFFVFKISINSVNKKSLIFDGVVKNSSKEPIENVKVVLEGIGEDITNSEGEFKIRSLVEKSLGDIINMKVMSKDKLAPLKEENFELSNFHNDRIEIILQNEY